MPNLIRVYVEEPDELLNASMYDAGAIVRLQSCATETGVFANETTAALVSGTRAYTLYDADGTGTTWYRTRYENAGGTIYSDWSDAFQVGGEEAGYLCSLTDVKQRLGIGDDVDTYDEELAELIRAVTAEIERQTGCDFTGDRSDQTYLFDVPYMSRVLWVGRGVQSVTTLAYATTSQPETSGTYTTISTGYYLRPMTVERDHLGEPASRIVLADTSSYWFYPGYNTVQLTARLGWAEVPPEVSRIAVNAVVSQHLTKGAAEPRAVIGPDGRATILRDISPADWDTLLRLAVVTVA